MPKEKKNKSRNSIFDLLRIILTIIVVNVHIRIITGVKSNFLEPFTWYTVPLFIVLSFFFAGNKLLTLRIKRLLLPLFFWSLFGFIIHPNLLNIKNIFLQIFTGHVVDTPLYYLALLVWFTIINWLIDYLPTRIRIVIYSLIILATLYLEYFSINYNFFIPMITVVEKSYGRFIELIKFVPIGLAFGYLNKKLNNKNIFLILSSSFLILFVAVSYIPVPPDFHFSGLKTLTGSVAIFSFVLLISNLKINDRLKNIIDIFGRYSFGVYLSHYLLLEMILKIDPTLKLFIAIYQIPFLLFYVVICYLFCFLFDFLTFKKLSYLVK